MSLGAVASSAPVLAQIDHSQYLEVVGWALKTFGGTDCYANVSEAFSNITSMFLAQDFDSIQKTFNLCNAPSDAFDIYRIMDEIISYFENGAQYNLIEYPDIYDICTVMTNVNLGNSLQRLSHLTAVTFNISHGDKCATYSYSAHVDYLKKTGDASDSIDRQWYYQRCTEFGRFRTTNSQSEPFQSFLPLEYYLSLCDDVFGNETSRVLPQRVNETNLKYGGLRPKTTNVVFVNGNVDPLYTMSILKPADPHIYSILINGTAHCADMDLPKAWDPPELADAQQTIFQLVKQWIKQHSTTHW